MNAIKKAVLFDVDGVLVRNPVISAAVEKKAVSYVRSRAKLFGERQAEMVNRKLYQSYGHTHTGVKFVYGIKDTIDDYNAHVYDKETMDICTRELARSDNQSAMQTIEALHCLKIPVYLFTNAPYVWTDAIIETLGLNIDKTRCITSSSGVKMADINVFLYKKVMEHVSRIDGPHQLVYVEDTFHNLSPIMHLESWLPVLLEPEYPCLNIGRTRVINNLEEILHIAADRNHELDREKEFKDW